VRAATALVIVGVLLATAALAIVGQTAADPLGKYRAPDGSLRIPGSALTPELQRLLFGGNDLQPYLNRTHFAPAPSSYPTMTLEEVRYSELNPNVFTRPTQPRESIAGAIAHLVARWFPPVDWTAQLRAAADGFLGLFTLNARASVVVDSTTVTDVSAAANTCTTSQSAGAADNGVLVMLSERGTFAFITVTYGSVSLSLIASTAANGGTFVRAEIWGFAGALPGGVQTMTATLSGGSTARMTCATILLQGVKSTGSFINGTSNSANSTNATVTLTAAVTTGNLAFAVAAIQNTGGAGAQPTAVSGTGAAATDLYGVAVGHCTGGGAANECAAGASIPTPGTAITWTNPSTNWVVSAVEVVANPTCATVGGGNCYRIGAGGAWNNPTNWSNSSGGAACGCTPLATDIAIFDASPTGTTTLAAATTVAALSMTGFAGTLDTTASNWALTVNGDLTIQGTLLPRGSTVSVTGNVVVLGATTVVTMASSAWTVNGTWTNNSTSASWSAGTSSVTVREASSGTLTFANLAGATNEFNNLTLDATVGPGLTYTMATNGLRVAGTLTVRNSTGGATGATILDTSASNLAVTAGALALPTWGALNTRTSTVTISGNVNISAATAYVSNTGGAWTITGTWTDASTSALWSFAAAMTFRAPASRTMTFGAQAGNEFAGAVTFDTTAVGGITYTMATNPLDAGGMLTIQNSAGGATAAVLLDTSATNLGVTAGGLVQSTWGAFSTRASTVTINGDADISATNAYISNTGGSWTVAGGWTDRTTSASWSFAASITFRAGVSKTMTFAGSNISGNEFGGSLSFDTTAVGGVTYTMSNGATGDSSLRIGGALTIRNGVGGATAAAILDTSAAGYAITAASLTLGSPRGALRSGGSTITINGAVTISDANSYLVLGSATWTVAGAWTNNSTDSGDWSAGTGTVIFRAGGNATMTFANLGANELNSVVFDTSAAAGVTYTMATNGLRVGGAVTVQNTAASPSGNVVLSTSASNLSLTSGSLVIGTRGTLTANGSTITVNGSWTSVAANHVWNPGTSTVVFGGSGALTMSAGESFNILTQSAGTTTLGSDVTVAGATAVNGTLDTSASNFALALQSTLSIGASGVLNLEASTASTSGNVTIAAGGAVKFTGAGTWTINGSWTDNNAATPANWAVATSTVRIVRAAATTLTFWTAAGSNEFNNLILDSSVAAGFTYTQVNALQAAGTLTTQNTAVGATGAVVLDATASNYGSNLGGLSLGALGAYASRSATVGVNGNVAVAATGYITSGGAGTWSVTGSWTNATAAASWAFSAPITFRSAAGQTMTFKAGATEFGGAVTFDTSAAGGVTYTMATNTLRLSGLLTVRNSVGVPTGNTILDTSGSNLGITAGSVTVGTNGTLRAQGSTINVGGNWTVTGANATFTAGTSSVVFTAAATITMTQPFHDLSVTAGNATLAANTTVNAALTVSSGTFAKGTFTLSTGTLNLSGGALTSTSGAGTVTGDVIISSPSSYLSLGSETWTVGGAWTNASTSGSWAAGSGTVVFNASTAATMIFAGTNLAGNEFNHVTFDTTAAGGVAFTMSTRGLRLAGTLTIRNSTGGATGPTVLDTGAAGLAVSATAVVVGVYGTLSANGSTISVGGNWTVTAANATFTAGTSTVTFGANATVAMAQAFYNLTVTAGTVTAASNITAMNLLTVSGGTLAKSTATLAAGGVRLSGGTLTSSSGDVSISGDVTISAAGSYIAFGSESWTVSGSWTNASTSASWNPGTATVTFNSSFAQTMTFAGANLGGNEFDRVVFNSGASTVTFTMATRGLRIGGALTVGGGSGTTTLDTGISGLPVDAISLDVIAGGVLRPNGSTVTVTSVDTHLGGLQAGTSTFVVNASGGTVNLSQTVNNLTVSAGVSTTFSGSLRWSGTLTLTNAVVDFGGSGLTSVGAATLTFAGATLMMGNGSWDTSSAATVTATGSSVTFSGTGSLDVGATASLATVTISAGTRTLLGPLTTAGLLTLSGGVLSKGTNALTANAGLTLSGGALTSVSGAVSIAGNVTISAASSYIAFGSESWTVSGSWTNGSASGSWSAGTATVTFDSAASRTMTFASLPGSAPEFRNVVFDAGPSTVTFTMAGNPLRWSGTLTVQGGSGTTTLATADLALAGGALSVGDAGLLTSNASAVSITNVTMAGAASGAIAVTTGAWTVSGTWDTSGAGSSFSAGTSTVTMTGTSVTIRLAGGQSFHNLTIDGTVSQSSPVTVLAALILADGAVLTKTGQSLTFNALTETGTGAIADGTASVVSLTVANSDPANLTTISAFSIWVSDSHYAWVHSSTVGTSVLTFTIGGNASGNRFDVTKDGAAFTTGFVDGSGNVVFTMLGSDPAMDVIVAAPCGGTRYWVGGTGNWSQTAHWSATSGGAGGCSVPNGASNVLFDGNSGGGAVTVDQNTSMATLNTAGWTGTIALGTFNLSVGGGVNLAGGILTIGASAGTGLSVTGNLTVSGSAALDGSGGASVVTVGGNAVIATATAYFRMGSGTWTFGGAWSNGSTSASWASGAGTVVFSSSVSQAMTFAALTGREFANVVFASTAGAGTVTFTMGTNPLMWSGTLTIQDSAGSATVLATSNLALSGGSLAVGNAGILTANGSIVAVADVTMTGGSSGTITVTTGAWTVTGSWDTSGAGSTFTKGTGTVSMSGAGRTLRILDPAAGFNNLTISGTITLSGVLDVSGSLAITGNLSTAGYDITGAANLVISGGGTLVATTSAISVSGVTMSDASANGLSMTSGSLAVSGSWNTSGPASLFNAGTSTVTLSAPSGTIALGASQSFAILVISGSYAQTTQLSASTLVLPTGGLSKGANPLTVTGDLTLSGGYLTSVSGNVSIAGNVDVSAAASYIAFGSETWTVSGSWTNASTSASWSEGAGTVTFNATASQTMRFAGTNLGGDEFNAVVFNCGSSTVTYTLTGGGLVAYSIVIRGGSGTTTLSTSGSSLPVTADRVTVASGGALEANGSTITVRSIDTSAGAFTAGTSLVVVNASGGSVNVPQLLGSLTVNAGVATAFTSSITWSGALTLTGITAAFSGGLASVGPASLAFGAATLTLAGSWDTSSASAFASAGSSVTFTGTSSTLTLGAGQGFATLTIAGNVALGSDLAATSLTVGASSVLTKTGYSISFNSLTVDGTIADGTVNVSDLTVTNSDGTAYVSISSFTAWSGGSMYAWTHTSSETAQAITWTIGGNPSGFLYTVSKDGAEFAKGTVDGSGRITFTMLGSDPAMQVTLGAPPLWLNPFVLMFAFTGLFVVVAMFVQRQRWRPAKAFLVDEHGQLLREFTLDPSCQVTYDQACQAGALDAQEKDVKVAKYHARTVVGDALAIVLLAYGPVNVHEVDFAREILTNVQDKFEDRVKGRLEEVRSAEAVFDDRHKVLQEGEADLQSRSRVFGDMVNTFTIARGKVDSHAASLGVKEADLASRESCLAQDRAALDELARQTESLRNSADARKAEVEEREAELEQTTKALKTREKTLGPLEQSVNERASELKTLESTLKEREAVLAAAQTQLSSEVDAQRATTAELDRREAELTEERKALDDLTTEAVAERKALDARAADLEMHEKEWAQKTQDIEVRESSLIKKEDDLAPRETDLAARTAALRSKAATVATSEASLAKEIKALAAKEAEVDAKARTLAEEQAVHEALAQDLDRRQKALDAQLADVTTQDANVAARTRDLEALKAQLGPREKEVLEKEKGFEAQKVEIAEQEARLQSQTDLVAAKALEIQQQLEAIREREESLAQDRALLNQARTAQESEWRDFQSTLMTANREMQSRREELDAQARSLGEQQLKFAQEKQEFEAVRAQKSEWIASKDIELESREQSLKEKEAAVRLQAEENAKSLADLAAREEALEIESAKLDKTLAELEAKKAELAATAGALETKTARSLAEEARRAEELRTWQSTLESEQTLLRQQRETFEAEMADIRESWAGRMLRVEQREVEVGERETKVQTDVEWVARNEGEIAKRQQTADETLKAANAAKSEAERLHKDLEQRAMEIESRERSVREDAANLSIELQKRTETLAGAEAELAGRRAQVERELATKAQRLQERDEELANRAQSLDAKLADLEGRELKLTSMQDALREEGDRIARERSDLQSLAQQMEGKQLQLAQAKELQEAEANRLRQEADAMHQSLAAKEADLRSERDRLERESSSLQDKLGTKAQEMAAREKALNARETELRSEEEDLESRIREIDSHDRQLQAHAAEMQTQSQTLAQHEKELSARSAQFDMTVQTFEAEAAAKRREWEDLQTSLKSQEAQLAASAETRQSEIAKRMEDLDHKERSLNAMTTQLQLERSRVEAQANALAAKETEIAGSLGRSEKRYSELRTMEEDLLKSRQAFESERATWSARRGEELRQLEATRDAAAEQTQQAERLIEESQRRAFVASEAEKAAKRQGDELAGRQSQLEARRAEAEKSERDLQAQMAQFTDLSQKIATRENELAARIRELEFRQGKLSVAEQANTAAADELRARKATLDQEAGRLATLAAETERRRAEDDARHASIEAKLEEIGKRDQQLATELQRADNLMEDLARKEASIQAREKGFVSVEAEFAQREAALVERNKELMDGMASLERMKKEHSALLGKTEDEHCAAEAERREAETIKAEAEKMKTQSDAMQAEVSKNMRFLQKKALDVLDREEKIRVREAKGEEANRGIEMRSQILEGKEKALEEERDELIAKMEKLKADNEKLRAKMTDLEQAQKPMVDMEEWKRDIDNRVKIIQRKALELLDREEKLRKRDEELRVLAEQLGVKP